MKMEIINLLKETGLDEEKIDSTVSRLLLEIGSTNVPKSEYNAKIAQTKQLRATIQEQDAHVRELENTARELSDLKKRLYEMQKNYEAETQALKQQIKSIQNDRLLDLELTRAGAIQPRAVKALLDLPELNYNGEHIGGLEQQIRKLKTSDPYLFYCISWKQSSRHLSRYVKKPYASKRSA